MQRNRLSYSSFPHFFFDYILINNNYNSLLGIPTLTTLKRSTGDSIIRATGCVPSASHRRIGDHLIRIKDHVLILRGDS
jgi:hypothetical protein